MKGIKFIVATSLLAISSGAYAQFANSSSRASVSSVSIDGWTGVWAEYNPIKIENDDDDMKMTGFSGGVSRAFSISQDSPLLLEAGVGVQYASGSRNVELFGYKWKNELNILSVKAPVNLLYGFEVPNSNISIYPFVGVTLRGNLSGEMTFKADGETLKADIFDEDKMNEEFYPLKIDAFERFQVGWQIGAYVRLGENIMVGASYGKDMSDIQKDCKLQTTSIIVKYTF